MFLRAYLDSFLFEFDLDGELFPQYNVRVVGLLERSFELVELLLGEDGAMTPLPLGHLVRRVVVVMLMMMMMML